jgi:hypothetical protein
MQPIQALFQKTNPKNKEKNSQGENIIGLTSYKIKVVFAVL